MVLPQKYPTVPHAHFIIFASRTHPLQFVRYAVLSLRILGEQARLWRFICENSEIDQWIADGCARAREIKHRREVRRLTARLIESRRMTADEFERFMQASM